MVLCLLCATPARANLPSSSAEIPNLRPPKAELPPSFWEEHGLVTAIGAPLTLMLLGVVIWLVTRPQPKAPTAPVVVARRALAALRGKPEDGVVLSRVSRVLKGYLASTFGLPVDQATTTEFCGLLKAHERVGADLAGSAADFLRRCDERKFAPPPAPGELGAVETALKLIASAEGRLAAPVVPPPPPAS